MPAVYTTGSLKAERISWLCGRVAAKSTAPIIVVSNRFGDGHGGNDGGASDDPRVTVLTAVQFMYAVIATVEPTMSPFSILSSDDEMATVEYVVERSNLLLVSSRFKPPIDIVLVLPAMT